jgi:hypothetical protein
MATAKLEVVVAGTLMLSGDEMLYIKCIMQNYLGPQDEPESADARKHREAIFNALPSFQELSRGC